MAQSMTPRRGALTPGRTAFLFDLEGTLLTVFISPFWRSAKRWPVSASSWPSGRSAVGSA